MVYATVSILSLFLILSMVYLLFIRAGNERKALKIADKTVKSMAKDRCISGKATVEDDGVFWVVTYGNNAVQVIIKKSNGKTVECYDRNSLC